MADIAKEFQKLKALINQKQTTAIFSNKSNESTKLALGDAELYINNMTRKFSFTRAGIKDPIMIDPKVKSIENLDYINGIKVTDVTNIIEDMNDLQEVTINHKDRIEVLESSDVTQNKRIDDVEVTIEKLEEALNDYNERIEFDEEDIKAIKNNIRKFHYSREFAMYIYLLKLCAEKFYGMKAPKLKANYLVVSTIPNFYSKVRPVTYGEIREGFHEFNMLLRYAAYLIGYKGYSLDERPSKYQL